MKVAIRADASVEIGTGHIMRCLTLATALQSQGAEVFFICKTLLENLEHKIRNQGFQVVRLEAGSDWNHSVDAQATISVIQQCSGEIDWLIIDHYQISRSWEQLVRPYIKKILVLDDLANRNHDCDLLLDQNLADDRQAQYQSLLPSHCLQLLGIDYLLLRSEFWQTRSQRQNRCNVPQTLLITMGGSDPSNMTSLILKALRSINQSLEIRVIIGIGCPYWEDIQLQINAVSQHTITCLHDVSNMASQMDWADVAISAGGFTVYELACMGVPAMIIATHPTQNQVSEAMHNYGINWFLGEASDLTVPFLEAQITQFLSNTIHLEKMTIQGQQSIDGLGVGRVIEMIYKLAS
ncbi:UDP-2,4-diacetamido-2,4,6-trideoxy-beta-L-altropyranose hydrolase [Alkalinema pantanalense CENA528]|uniref:UDP-2,4-diacetamido-2,4, 6-trideoxy-beta-L-altropyranose hydrolase n=1 Tax=Alkalinema pantanalense TaxID=1620705 RepID=UPI003D6DF1D7